ncbi:MAG: sugar kinase [Eubacteriales bacterium]
MKKFDVLDIGIIVADIPVKVPCSSIDFLSDTFRVEKIEICEGGDAANSAVVLSQLGKKVALAGALGNDGIGNLVRGMIASKGVETGTIRMKDGVQTSVSIVLVNSQGDRTFICTRGNNITLCLQDLDFSLIQQTRHINISSLFAHPLLEKDGISFFKAAGEAGVTISADVGHDNYNTGFAGVADLMQYVDLFMPSYVEAKYMTGETEPKKMAEFFIRHTGQKIVVIKLGAEGCFVFEKGKGYNVPAFKVESIDTTGAGDNFVAGFLHAYLDGMPIRDCARFACAAAAISTQYLGATSPLATLQKIRELLGS